MCLLPLQVRGNRTFDPLRISTVALGKVKFLIDVSCASRTQKRVRLLERTKSITSKTNKKISNLTYDYIQCIWKQKKIINYNNKELLEKKQSVLFLDKNHNVVMLPYATRKVVKCPEYSTALGGGAGEGFGAGKFLKIRLGRRMISPEKTFQL